MTVGHAWPIVVGMKLRSDARLIVATLNTTTLILVVLCDDKGVEWAYGREDWAHTTSPSFGWDDDGDLRQHDGARFYGASWAEREGTVDELIAAWGDVAFDYLVERAS